jgi:plastocyanin
MRRTFLAALTLVLLALPSMPASAGIAGKVVWMGDNSYSPATVKVDDYRRVYWWNSGSTAHTTTSTQGFWNAVVMPGKRFVPPTTDHMQYFYGAGTYPYGCTYHAAMTGSVRVPIVPSATSTSVGAPVTLKIAELEASGVFRFGVGPTSTHDVQRRYGSGDWVTIKEGITRRNITFTPKKLGTFQFRARTSEGQSRSSWSPRVTIEVGEAP